MLSRRERNQSTDPALIEKMITGINASVKDISLEDLQAPFLIFGSRIRFRAPKVFRSDIILGYLNQFALFRRLTTFAWTNNEGPHAIHKFRSALQIAQTRLFMRAQNLHFLMKKQNPAELNVHVQRIVALARTNKLPLINVAWSKEVQHIIVARDAKLVHHGEIHINVIDNEDPQDLNTNVIINFEDGKAVRASYLGRPIDLHLVDEDEDRIYLDAALEQHYRARCIREALGRVR